MVPNPLGFSDGEGGQCASSLQGECRRARRILEEIPGGCQDPEMDDGEGQDGPFTVVFVWGCVLRVKRTVGGGSGGRSESQSMPPKIFFNVAWRGLCEVWTKEEASR